VKKFSLRGKLWRKEEEEEEDILDKYKKTRIRKNVRIKHEGN